MMNIVNGGAHADSGVDVQEFMIAPIGAPTFREALRWGAEVYHSLKSVLKKAGFSTALGDEGGFAPAASSSKAALDLISEAITKAGFSFGSDVVLAHGRRRHRVPLRRRLHATRAARKTSDEMIAIYTDLIANYPIVSIEDPLSEDDWDGWISMTTQLGDKIQIVGDDLFVTNPERLEDGIARGAANALLVKVNQIGTLSETLDAVTPGAQRRLPLHDEPPLRRDRGHHHRRPRGGHRVRPDQDRRPGPLRAGRQVQPAAADRGEPRRRGPLPRRAGLPALHRGVLTPSMSSTAAPPGTELAWLTRVPGGRCR